MTVLGYGHLAAGLLHLVHYLKAPSLELRGAYGLVQRVHRACPPKLPEGER